MMQRAYAFDTVHDSQRVFRALLRAFANPGRVVRIDQEAAGLPGPHAAQLALACALTDSATGYCVVDCPELDDQIAQWTFGRRSPLQQADFIFVPGDCTDARVEEILDAAPTGSLEEPHRGAMIAVHVQEIGDPGVTLSGPGIDGQTDAPLQAAAIRWLRQRQAMDIEYPRGMELVFLTGDGALLAAPRLVRHR